MRTAFRPDAADAEDEREERAAIRQFDGDGSAAEFDLTIPDFLDRRINLRNRTFAHPARLSPQPARPSMENGND